MQLNILYNALNIQQNNKNGNKNSFLTIQLFKADSDNSNRLNITINITWNKSTVHNMYR